MKDLLVNYAIATLLHVLADVAMHSPLKRPMLKVFKTVWSVYQTDTEFQAIVKPTADAAGTGQ